MKHQIVYTTPTHAKIGLQSFSPHQAGILSMAAEKFLPQDLHFLISHERMGASHIRFDNSTQKKR